MANFEHFAKLHEGVTAWNAWRIDNPRADIDLSQADLSEADLREANIIMANLLLTDLSRTDLSGALLIRARLGGAKLCDASLRSTHLIEADLSGADLSGADLHGADLSGADLSRADLSRANLKKAKFKSARLQSAILDRADATDIYLWEAQRAGWSIKGIVCKRAYWDEDGKEPNLYAPGEFERLFSEQPRIELFYKGGLSRFELNTLPALLQHLTTLNPSANIRLKYLEEVGGGAKVSISVEDADDKIFEKIKADAKQAHGAQLAIRDDRIAQLEIENRLLLGEVFPRMLVAVGHHVHINDATGVSIGSTSPITINAPRTRNDLSSVLPLLTKLMDRRDELALPKDQKTRLETAIQSMKDELHKKEPKASIVSEGLKMVKEIAVKAAVNAAEKADWHSMLNQLTHIVHLAL